MTKGRKGMAAVGSGMTDTLRKTFSKLSAACSISMQGDTIC